jgi:hypothetical protein
MVVKILSKRLFVEQIIIHDSMHVKIFLLNKCVSSSSAAPRYLGQSRGRMPKKQGRSELGDACCSHVLIQHAERS